MDAFHARLVRVGLAAIGHYGFCLAGGYAVQAHGFVVRRSEDVDLFTTVAIEAAFPEAVAALVTAYESDGLTVTVDTQAPSFARLNVADGHTGASTRVELGVDWRAYPPVQFELGPVLHEDDAVANKLCALYGRGEVRDYVDVDGIVQSGRYSTEQLIELARGHDPGFNVEILRADASGSAGSRRRSVGTPHRIMCRSGRYAAAQGTRSKSPRALTSAAFFIVINGIHWCYLTSKCR